nr:hypothetical protein [Mycoplasmopsis bovis]QQH18749.1 hypothetical protein HYE49_00885 [Mycoplasmopsis bovis]
MLVIETDYANDLKSNDLNSRQVTNDLNFVHYVIFVNSIEIEICEP